MIKLDVSDFLQKQMRIKEKIQTSLIVYGNSASKMLETKAKTDATWIDRTGNARISIQGSVNNLGMDKVQIVLSGNTSYFPYLELAMGKKYAILYPTIQANSQEILSKWAKVIE